MLTYSQEPVMDTSGIPYDAPFNYTWPIPLFAQTASSDAVTMQWLTGRNSDANTIKPMPFNGQYQIVNEHATVSLFNAPF